MLQQVLAEEFVLVSVHGSPTHVLLPVGMMSEAPQYARYAIIEHVVHLVNRDYEAMCRDYYTLEVSFVSPLLCHCGAS